MFVLAFLQIITPDEKNVILATLFDYLWGGSFKPTEYGTPKQIIWKIFNTVLYDALSDLPELDESQVEELDFDQMQYYRAQVRHVLVNDLTLLLRTAFRAQETSHTSDKANKKFMLEKIENLKKQQINNNKNSFGAGRGGGGGALRNAVSDNNNQQINDTPKTGTTPFGGERLARPTPYSGTKKQRSVFVCPLWMKGECKKTDCKDRHAVDDFNQADLLNKQLKLNLTIEQLKKLKVVA